MKEFIIEFFKKPINRWFLIILYSIISAILGYNLSIPDLKIFPNSATFSGNSYDDSAIGGTSKILETIVSDSIFIHFDLEDGFTSPYVGATFANTKGDKIDLSAYNTVLIDANVANLRGLSFALFAPHKLSPPHINPEIILGTNIDMDSDRYIHKIRLDQLKIPDWWYHMNEIEDAQIIPIDWSSITNINIGSVHTSTKNESSTLTIHAITLVRDNSKIVFILILCSILIPFILMAVQYLLQIAHRNPPKLTVEYRSVEVNEEKLPSNIFMKYINEKFHLADITLEQVSHETGIYDRRIAQHIQNNFNCNFKTYLNQLRIAESKRLLISTELNAGEIASKVGFTNQSHFNRVFKNMENMSPTQYRSSKR
jgi:AraC-like DNA-binding protein